MSEKNIFLRILGKESLYMLLVTLIACIVAPLQTVMKTYDGDYSSFIFSGTNYKYNIPMYILGLVIFVIAAVVLYKSILARDFAKTINIRVSLRIVLWVVLLLWGAIMAISEFLSMYFLVLGMTTNMLPELLMLFTIVAWPILTLIFLEVMTLKNNKKVLAKKA